MSPVLRRLSVGATHPTARSTLETNPHGFRFRLLMRCHKKELPTRPSGPLKCSSPAKCLPWKTDQVETWSLVSLAATPPGSVNCNAASLFARNLKYSDCLQMHTHRRAKRVKDRHTDALRHRNTGVHSVPCAETTISGSDASDCAEHSGDQIHSASDSD